MSSSSRGDRGERTGREVEAGREKVSGREVLVHGMAGGPASLSYPSLRARAPSPLGLLSGLNPVSDFPKE